MENAFREKERKIYNKVILKLLTVKRKKQAMISLQGMAYVKFILDKHLFYFIFSDPSWLSPFMYAFTAIYEKLKLCKG